MSDAVISVRGLGKRYVVWTHGRPTKLSERVRFAAARARRPSESREGAPRREEIWALRDVSFDVRPGEILGVIGKNGAGKSTMLSLLSRVTAPTEGEITIAGRVGSLLEVGTGFHPELSGRDNIFLNGAILGMRRAEVAERFEEIVDFSGVRDFIDIPVKRYSSGMYVRLGFAVAAHFDPEVLILDEVLAVGDRGFQEKCLRRIEEMMHSGRTVIFVSHDVNSVARLCTRAVLLEQGRLTYEGSVEEAVERYLGRHGHLGEAQTVPGRLRAGTGAVRVGHVVVGGTDSDGELYPDRPATIEIELQPKQPWAGRLEVQLDVTSPLGDDLATLSTSLDPDGALSELELDAPTVIDCELPELPLKPGSYFLTVTLTRDADIVDRFEDAAEFTVRPSDFFGGGVMPAHDHGPLLLRHRWRVAADARVPAQ